MMFTSGKSVLFRASGAALSGLLLSLGFPGSWGMHQGLPWAIPLAGVPLFAVWQTLPRGTRISETGRAFETRFSHRFWSAFFYAWIMGCACVTPAFFWVTKPTILFGGVPAPLAYALFLCYVGLSALYFCALLLPFLWDAGRQAVPYASPIPAFFLAPLSVAIELTCPRFFHWSLGSLMHGSAALNQWAAVSGFSTLSLPLIFTWAALGRLFFTNTRNSGREILTATAVSLLWCCLWFTGYTRISRWDSGLLSAFPKTTVGIVQPHFTFSTLSPISSPLTGAAPTESDGMPSLEVMKSLSLELKTQAQSQGKPLELVIWPESTLPFEWWSAGAQTQKDLRDWVVAFGVPLLVQSTDVSPEELEQKGPGGSSFYSVSFLIRPNNSVSKFHQKWIPMPFGESVPLEDLWPRWGQFVRRYVRNLSRLGRGKTYDALAFNAQSYVAPLICFDTIAPELPRMQARFGQASLFVNQANFVWMGRSGAALQFRELGRFRGIENGRSFLMVSNNGPSIFFDPLGRPLRPSTGFFSREVALVDVPVPRGSAFTRYTLWGEFPLWALAVMGLVGTVLLRLKRQYR